MLYSNVKYIRDEEGTLVNIIKADINGVTKNVPTDPANADYAEIMRQVEAGTLVIQEAE